MSSFAISCIIKGTYTLNRKRDTMPEYSFFSQQKIASHNAATKEDARDIFITQSFDHLITLRSRYPIEKIVRSAMPVNQKDTIIFTVDNVEIERWQLRPSWGLKHLIRKLIGDE